MAYMGHSSYILYFAKIKDFSDKEIVKIGITYGCPSKRVLNLQTGCPFKIELWKAFDLKTTNYQKIEKAIHQEMEPYRTVGEWFELNDDSREIVDSVFERLKESSYCIEHLKRKNLLDTIEQLLAEEQ